MQQQPLQLHVLGGLQLTHDDRAVSGLASRKAEALLVYLALNPRFHTREQVATLLWDDLPQQRSLGNLSVLLSSLRKQHLDPFLITNRQEISIHPDSGYWLDAAVFAEQITAVQRQLSITDTLSRTLSKQLAQAIDLYQGDFLAGFYVRDATGFSEWALQEQERLRRLALEALELLVGYYLERQSPSDGIPYAYRLVQLDPLLEEGQRQLMMLLAQDGRRNAALDQFQQCCQVLQQELGIEPDEATTALYTAIKNDEIEPLPNTAVALIPHNLTAAPNTLVGRTAELAQIKTRLGEPGCRLLTLLGSGGVGKTRLAQAAARQLLPDFEHGVWFVPLVSLDDADYLATAVADALSFSFSGSQDTRSQLLNYLRHKEMLLILDNFEHLLTDAGVAFVTTLLAQSPELKLLITSRERLHISAEWLLELGGLAYPPAAADGGASYAALQLFIERARQVDEAIDWEDEAQQTAVAQICRSVMGLPLGIELAAASVRYYDVAHIPATLHQNLDFWASRQRDLPARHRSLRAVFDNSWALLTVAEQHAFAALSVFRGHFSPEAALAVTQSGLPVLHTLVDKSLLQRLENGRLQQHQMLRQYAAERLTELETAVAAQQRHSTYYLRLLQTHLPKLRGGAQRATLELLQMEIENARVAWQAAQQLDAQTPDLLPLLYDAAEALYHFYAMRSWFMEGTAVFQQGTAWLADVPGDAATSLRARLLARRGWLLYLLGNHDAGRAGLAQALAQLAPLPSVAEHVFVHNYLGVINFYEGDVAVAEAHLQQALALAESLNDELGLAIGRNIMGALRVSQQRYEEAAAWLESSVALKRKLHDEWGMAFSLESLGDVAVALNELARAQELYEESLATRRQIGDRRGEALALASLAKLAAAQGNTSVADTLNAQVQRILAEIGEAPNNELHLFDR